MLIGNDQGRGITLVIGSGGVLCASALGVWKVLLQENIPITRVVGCSGGSIFAAAIALGYRLEQTCDLARSLWTIDLMDGYPANLRAAMRGEMRFDQTSGLASGETLYKRLKSGFKEHTFAQARIPLSIVATDLYTGESETFSSGSMVDALRASTAIPIIFSPWQIGDRLFVDGAVSDPLPVDVAIKEGAEVIIALGFELPPRLNLRSYTAVTAHFNTIYMNNILKSSFAFHNIAHYAEIIPILPQFDNSIQPFDGSQVDVIMERGVQAAEEQIVYLRELLAQGAEAGLNG